MQQKTRKEASLDTINEGDDVLLYLNQKRTYLVKIEVGKKMLKLKLCKAYGETEKGAPLAIIGSHNFLELSVNMGNASEKLGIKQGELVKITPITTSH